MSIFGILQDELGDGVEGGGSYDASNDSISSLPGSHFDARPDHGRSGLANQGATCYLNSLLQFLFCTPEFRTRLYKLSFDELGTPLYDELVEKKRLAAEAKARGEEPEEDAKPVLLDSDPVVQAVVNMMGFDPWLSMAAIIEHVSDVHADATLNDTQQMSVINAVLDATPSLKRRADELRQRVEAFKKAAAEESQSPSTDAQEDESESPDPWAALRGSNSSCKGRGWRVPIELRRLFALMQEADSSAVSTLGITASFGWTGEDRKASVQHDIHELNRKLMDALERSLAHTKRDQDLVGGFFRGHSITSIYCTKCEQTRERKESFLDLPVTVEGLPSLEASLASYTGVQLMQGKNRYRCSMGCNNKKRDARLQTCMSQLPPMLVFNLKRFKMNYRTGNRSKLESGFAFPLRLDMRSCTATALDVVNDQPFSLKHFTKQRQAGAQRDTDKHGENAVSDGSGDGSSGDQPSSDSDKTQSSTETVYELAAVVVHAGSAHQGHYYAIVRDVSSPSLTAKQIAECKAAIAAEDLASQEEARRAALQAEKDAEKNSGGDGSKKGGKAGKDKQQDKDKKKKQGKKKEQSPAHKSVWQDLSDAEARQLYDPDDVFYQLPGQWFLFNDSSVTPVRDVTRIMQTFGNAFGRGKGGHRGFRGRTETAYMLVYRRRDMSVESGKQTSGGSSQAGQQKNTDDRKDGYDRKDGGDTQKAVEQSSGVETSSHRSVTSSHGSVTPSQGSDPVSSSDGAGSNASSATPCPSSTTGFTTESSSSSSLAPPVTESEMKSFLEYRRADIKGEWRPELPAPLLRHVLEFNAQLQVDRARKTLLDNRICVTVCDERRVEVDAQASEKAGDQQTGSGARGSLGLAWDKAKQLRDEYAALLAEQNGHSAGAQSSEDPPAEDASKPDSDSDHEGGGLLGMMDGDDSDESDGGGGLFGAFGGDSDDESAPIPTSGDKPDVSDHPEPFTLRLYVDQRMTISAFKELVRAEAAKLSPGYKPPPPSTTPSDKKDQTDGEQQGEEDEEAPLITPIPTETHPMHAYSVLPTVKRKKRDRAPLQLSVMLPGTLLANNGGFQRVIVEEPLVDTVEEEDAASDGTNGTSGNSSGTGGDAPATDGTDASAPSEPTLMSLGVRSDTLLLAWDGASINKTPFVARPPPEPVLETEDTAHKNDNDTKENAESNASGVETFSDWELMEDKSQGDSSQQASSDKNAQPTQNSGSDNRPDEERKTGAAGVLPPPGFHYDVVRPRQRNLRVSCLFIASAQQVQACGHSRFGFPDGAVCPPHLVPPALRGGVCVWLAGTGLPTRLQTQIDSDATPSSEHKDAGAASFPQPPPRQNPVAFAAVASQTVQQFITENVRQALPMGFLAKHYPTCQGSSSDGAGDRSEGTSPSISGLLQHVRLSVADASGYLCPVWDPTVQSPAAAGILGVSLRRVLCSNREHGAFSDQLAGVTADSSTAVGELPQAESIKLKYHMCFEWIGGSVPPQQQDQQQSQTPSVGTDGDRQSQPAMWDPAAPQLQGLSASRVRIMWETHVQSWPSRHFARFQSEYVPLYFRLWGPTAGPVRQDHSRVLQGCGVSLFLVPQPQSAPSDNDGSGSAHKPQQAPLTAYVSVLPAQLTSALPVGGRLALSIRKDAPLSQVTATVALEICKQLDVIPAHATLDTLTEQQQAAVARWTASLRLRRLAGSRSVDSLFTGAHAPAATGDKDKSPQQAVYTELTVDAAYLMPDDEVLVEVVPGVSQVLSCSQPTHKRTGVPSGHPLSTRFQSLLVHVQRSQDSARLPDSQEEATKIPQQAFISALPVVCHDRTSVSMLRDTVHSFVTAARLVAAPEVSKALTVTATDTDGDHKTSGSFSSGDGTESAWEAFCNRCPGAVMSSAFHARLLPLHEVVAWLSKRFSQQYTALSEHPCSLWRCEGHGVTAPFWSRRSQKVVEPDRAGSLHRRRPLHNQWVRLSQLGVNHRGFIVPKFSQPLSCKGGGGGMSGGYLWYQQTAAPIPGKVTLSVFVSIPSLALNLGLPEVPKVPEAFEMFCMARSGGKRLPAGVLDRHSGVTPLPTVGSGCRNHLLLPLYTCDVSSQDTLNAFKRYLFHLDTTLCPFKAHAASPRHLRVKLLTKSYDMGSWLAAGCATLRKQGVSSDRSIVVEVLREGDGFRPLASLSDIKGKVASKTGTDTSAGDSSQQANGTGGTGGNQQNQGSDGGTSLDDKQPDEGSTTSTTSRGSDADVVVCDGEPESMTAKALLVRVYRATAVGADVPTEGADSDENKNKNTGRGGGEGGGGQQDADAPSSTKTPAKKSKRRVFTAPGQPTSDNMQFAVLHPEWYLDNRVLVTEPSTSGAQDGSEPGGHGPKAGQRKKQGNQQAITRPHLYQWAARWFGRYLPALADSIDNSQPPSETKNGGGGGGGGGGGEVVTPVPPTLGVCKFFLGDRRWQLIPPPHFAEMGKGGGVTDHVKNTEDSDNQNDDKNNNRNKKKKQNKLPSHEDLLARPFLLKQGDVLAVVDLSAYMPDGPASQDAGVWRGAAKWVADWPPPPGWTARGEGWGGYKARSPAQAAKYKGSRARGGEQDLVIEI